MRGRERNRCCKRGEEKPSFPTFVRPREEDGVQCRQNSIVLLRFFQRIVSETTSFCTKCVVSLKKKSIKKCQFPNQSSIEILILRINSIASLSNSNVSPEVGHIFSLWSLVLNLCILTLNLSTNFQFLQYDLWFGQFQSLCLRVFFNLVLGFGFLQLSS